MRQTAITWQVGFVRSPHDVPAEWVPATVPGAVQLDWARAHGWPDHNIADHWRDYLWMEDVYWIYRGRLEFGKLPRGARLRFHCGGVDYRFLVRLKGEVLHEQEGMFTPFTLDLTGKAAPGDELEVVVFPAPKSRAAPADRVQANQSCKPAVAYSWDFHPRLIPLGIWQETRLEVAPVTDFADVEVLADLSEDLRSGRLTLRWALTQPGPVTLVWRVMNPRGRTVAAHTAKLTAGPGDSGCATTASRLPSDAMALAHATVGPAPRRPSDALALEHATVGPAPRRPTGELVAEIAKPALWWPNGQGTPALYTSVVELRDRRGQVFSRRAVRNGFRRVRLVMHPGAWDEPHPRVFPKSRSHPPITLEVNGRAIFGKGANWVTPDIFPGQVTGATYWEHLTLVQQAHMNLLRCWGGANVQKREFFELCDELGIMLWQEFPLACNRYDGTPAYLTVLDQESRSIIRQLRHHASLVIWCGGNELFNAWSGMTDQDLALRLLNRNCYDLDPQRPFLPTSPLDGMGHGHYIFRSPEGKEVFQLFAEANCTAYTEFGCGGPASADLIRRVIPEADLFPVRAGTAWETHHAVKAWEPNSHLLLDVIECYLGPCRSVEEISEKGQFLQGEGLKCLFEEARRQKPHAAMALNWCLNEPWPCAANMSIVEWPARPKAAYFQVAKALRPVLASAKIARFTWREGDVFNPELWLLNDSPDALPAGRVEAWLQVGQREEFLLGWDHGAVEANRNLAGPVVRFVLPHVAAAERMALVLRCPGQPAWDSAYTVLYAPADAPALADVTRRLNE